MTPAARRAMSDDQLALSHFSGTVRLFPLPNLVLFPHVMQPLHIFEPRYRQMTADALAGDRLIAMALLRPGWESDYAGNPPVHPVACLGRIVAEQRLEDGRFNLLLRGLSRVRLTGEVPADRLYRVARGELLAGGPAPPPEVDRKLRQDLARVVLPRYAGRKAVQEQVAKLFQADNPLGVVSDLLAFTLPLDVEVRQQLLEVLNVERRARLLLGQLEQPPPAAPGGGPRPFPPEFSTN